MSEMYHDGHRDLQQQFDTGRLAQRFEDLTHDVINDDRREFIEGRDMFFLATVDPEGRPNCSYKGGAPGFIRVVDERTVAFPSYDGNGMYLSMGNIAETSEVGMLFIDFTGQQRLRLNGTATMDRDDALLAEYPEAQLIVRVQVREVFANCARYIHKMELVERSVFVPEPDSETPVVAWKANTIEGGRGETLPEGDTAFDAGRDVRAR